jgi:MOSC domain-containing protein YiiM
MNGRIEAIYIAPEAGATTRAVESVGIESGRGLVGDRYYNEQGTFSEKLRDNRKKEITFIESEEIEEFNRGRGLDLGPGELRRNVITRGVRLNDLVGKEFSVGGLRFRGLDLCEPCAYLAKTVNPDVLPHLVHKAGLRAAILSSGTLAVGAEFEGEEP